jgi:DNA invertase Pin-like site-specific DNA recombinase
MTQFVAYFRVSTVRQGQSGLEAQQTAVQHFLRGDVQLVTTFTEVESGKKNERPQL